MNNPQKDPLASIFVDDAKAVDRKKLAKLLQSFVKIDKDSKEIIFLDAFSNLSNMDKIEIILATTKAKSLFLGENDGLSPSSIISLDIMAEGSAKGSLKKLFDSHKIKKDKEGRYFIPAYNINKLAERFNH